MKCGLRNERKTVGAPDLPCGRLSCGCGGKMRNTLIFLVLLLPFCLQAKDEQGGIIRLDNTYYAAGKVYPETVRPGDTPMAVFYARKKCNVRMTVYAMDGTVLDEKTVNNVSGKGGVYINTVKMKEGLYFCSIAYIKDGKIFDQAVARFIYAGKKPGKAAGNK